MPSARRSSRRRPRTGATSARPRRSASCSTTCRSSCWPEGSRSTTSTPTSERHLSLHMLRIAVPNKGSLADPAADMLRECGYRERRDGRELVLADPDNDAEFFFLRPRDVAVYVGSGTLDVGITGRDLLLDSGADAEELLTLGF